MPPIPMTHPIPNDDALKIHDALSRCPAKAASTGAMSTMRSDAIRHHVLHGYLVANVTQIAITQTNPIKE